MNKKDLEKLGLTAEVIEKAGLESNVLDSIIVLHGKDIEKHKTAVGTAQTEAEGLKGQLTEANTTIEGFKKLDVEGIKAAADEWKAKAEQAATDAAAQVATLRFDHALDGALVGAKAKNAKAVKALLKADDLKLAEDGTIVGLQEQLEKIKSESDYLFESDEPAPKIVAGTHPKPIIGDATVDAARKAAGLPVAKE